MNYRDPFNFTPLMLAARFGNERAVEMLSDMDADPRPENCTGLTAFQVLLQEVPWMNATPSGCPERCTGGCARRTSP